MRKRERRMQSEKEWEIERGELREEVERARELVQKSEERREAAVERGDEQERQYVSLTVRIAELEQEESSKSRKSKFG